jgi:hypothetical protein
MHDEAAAASNQRGGFYADENRSVFQFFQGQRVVDAACLYFRRPRSLDRLLRRFGMERDDRSGWLGRFGRNAGNHRWCCRPRKVQVGRKTAAEDEDNEQT